jgi:hypothetical protein
MGATTTKIIAVAGNNRGLLWKTLQLDRIHGLPAVVAPAFFPFFLPKEAKKDIKTVLLAPQQNYGKDNYTINLTGPEQTYWLGTESGLLGAFLFDGACTTGDGSCDVASHSMGVGFCNLNRYDG